MIYNLHSSWMKPCSIFNSLTDVEKTRTGTIQHLNRAIPVIELTFMSLPGVSFPGA